MPPPRGQTQEPTPTAPPHLRTPAHFPRALSALGGEDQGPRAVWRICTLGNIGERSGCARGVRFFSDCREKCCFFKCVSVCHTHSFLLSEVCPPQPEAPGGYSCSLLSPWRPAQGLALEWGPRAHVWGDSFSQPWAEPRSGCGVTFLPPFPVG